MICKQSLKNLESSADCLAIGFKSQGRSLCALALWVSRSHDVPGWWIFGAEVTHCESKVCQTKDPVPRIRDIMTLWLCHCWCYFTKIQHVMSSPVLAQLCFAYSWLIMPDGCLAPKDWQKRAVLSCLVLSETVLWRVTSLDTNTTTGWWLTYPSEKWWSSSVGMMKFPTEWKVIKFVFQTTNQFSMIYPWFLSQFPHIFPLKSHVFQLTNMLVSKQNWCATIAVTVKYLDLHPTQWSKKKWRGPR